MDFSYTEEQQDVIDLATRILRENATHERQREIESAGGVRFDPELWRQLAEAGLVGVLVPEAEGGAGLTFLEAAAVLQQAGRTTAPVPLLETVVMASHPIARFGTAAQRKAWLPGIAAGEVIATAALQEAHGDPRDPATAATPEGDGYRLRGTKLCVPAAELAKLMLVSASVPGAGPALFLVDPASPGVARTRLDTTSGRPESRVDLDLAVGSEALLGGAPGREALGDLLDHTSAALAAFGLGVCERALELTAEYAKTRKQFDQPIAMFQAVGHRAADAYIDVEGIRLTALQAAWRLAEGLPAEREVALAKYWVAEAGQRVVAAAQHLHGGVGVDREYPLHRCYLHAKEVELTLGGTTPQLRRIGRLLADAAPA